MPKLSHVTALVVLGVSLAGGRIPQPWPDPAPTPICITRLWPKGTECPQPTVDPDPRSDDDDDEQPEAPDPTVSPATIAPVELGVGAPPQVADEAVPVDAVPGLTG